MKKTVYFIRHGQTDSNAAQRYQDATTELSEKGKRQAEFVAKRCAELGAQCLFVSTMKRAQQTADAIARATLLVPVVTENLRELSRPSILRGKLMNDHDIAVVKDYFEKYFTVPNAHHSDEENFYDLRERAAQALGEIIAREESTIIVVTHGTFLKMLFAVMMDGDRVEEAVFESLMRFLIADNTGITTAEWDGKNWFLRQWNDDAHLAEVP